MRNILYIFLYPCLTFMLYSCGYVEWETNLYAQKIEGTSKVLYKYNASGGRDTMVSGYILLDSTETFEIDLSKNLPFTYLEDIPNKNYIIGVESEEPNNEKKNLFKPIKNSSLNEQGIEIKTKIYQYNGFNSRSGGLSEYEFESFKETHDSIIFYNLDDVKSIESKHIDSLKFKKRNVLLRQNKNKEVIKIDIEDLIISKKNCEVISNITYFLTPKKKLKSSLFTDHGIFKEVK